MATEQLLVRLSMDSRQYKKSAREASIATGTIGKSADVATGRVDKMRAGFRKIGPAVSIAGLAATAAIGKFTADSIRDASNLQESINAINVVFGESADGIHAIGEESAESFGLSQRAFNEFATRFSAFAEQIAERDGQNVVDVVDEITGRISDFASVHNLSLERAAEVAQSTLAGETEVFRRFGGDVSAAAVQAKLLEEGIVGVGDEMTEQDKIMGRYMLFMEQTADTAGDFANTSDDLANKQRIFAATLEDTRAEIGEELLPVMTDLLDVGQDLIPMLVTIGEVVGRVGRGLAIVLAGSDFERLQSQIGGAADNAAGLATAIVELDRTAGTAAEIRELPDDIRAFIDEADLAPDAIRTVIDNMDFLTDSMGLSGDTAEFLADLLAEELSEAMYETRDSALLARDEIVRVGEASGSSAGEVDTLTEAVDRQGGKWDDVITSMESYETMLRRLTDPVFAAIDDQVKLETATQNYLDVIGDSESTIGEQEQAMLDLVQAQIAAGESAADLPDDIRPSIDSIIILGRQAGIAEDDLARLRGSLMDLDGTEVNASVNINVTRSGVETGLNPNTDITLRHSGGPGRAGQPYRIRPDEEIFVPSGNGEFLLNNEVLDALRGLSSSSNSTTTNTYNIPVQSTGDANTDAQLVSSISSVLRRMETL